MKRHVLVATALAALLTPVGCRREYSVSQASDADHKTVEATLRQYLEEKAAVPPSVPTGVPQEFLDPEANVRVLEVVQMGNKGFRARIEAVQGNKSTRRFCIIKKDDGKYAVASIF